MSEMLNQDSSDNKMLCKMLAKSASVLIWIANTEKQCIYFNDAWLKFRGKTIEQEYGFGWAAGVHADDYDRCLAIYTDAFDKREAFNMDYRLLDANDEYRWIRDEGRPYFDNDGTFGGYIGSCFDITDVIELQSRVIQSEKMEALGKLAGGLAHDFNNKLAGIMGYAQLITALSKDEKAIDLAEKITRVCEKTGQTTKTLLEFAKKREIVSFEFDVHKVIKDALQILQHSLGKNIEISSHLDAQSSRVRGDESAIENVILNLCLNAKDAIEGEGRVAIHTKNIVIDQVQKETNFPEIQAGQYLSVVVKDNGSGISERDIVNIFDPFFTTKPEGTGLGLSSSFATVRQHEGLIKVTSTLNKGTTFTILLPVSAS
ncbi:two-component system sensor histidine kinase NtrB [Alteromonas facilis]|uniref:two-component system sensor histidine kinase NtrB n=1 Tax=Alteromonas facilis TaxID=2048004 RepID=UPI000C294D9A|nr:PAS domain-containing sensor histidine kinase [Alteromonas facilis]